IFSRPSSMGRDRGGALFPRAISRFLRQTQGLRRHRCFLYGEDRRSMTPRRLDEASMRVILSHLFLTASLALACPAAAQDLLIHGGPIYTGAAKVEALAVKDGKVAFAGPVGAARKAAPG